LRKYRTNTGTLCGVRAVCAISWRQVLAFFCFSLVAVFAGPMARGNDRPDWVEQVGAYPVGQTDPFSDTIHRLQVLKLFSYEREDIQRDFPGWDSGPTLLADLFPHCYESLQLRFDPHEFEERGRFLFARDFEPHQVDPNAVLKTNQTYSLHIDRYADPRYEGRYSGAILLVPGTGSYGGNYVKFALSMAALKGYIVYAIDPLYHGRSHGHKLIRKSVEGEGTGVSLPKAIGEDGNWNFLASLEPGWEEVHPGKVNLSHFVTNIQAVGRRIAKREEKNLAHLNDAILALPPEQRSETWFGKPVNSLTHVTLIGTSQGGETAFWSADPRATGQGEQAAYGILYPFDSVICHDIYNSAFTAPQKRMKMLRSSLAGGLCARIMADRDSLWENADWTKYYDGVSLFLRAADRWVRWRYDMEGYQALLRYGKAHRDTLPQMRLPLLVSIGKNDRLYPNDRDAQDLVMKLFKELQRVPGDQSAWFLQFQTPPGMNGHQLLVHHTFPFVDLVDEWIRYRRGGPDGFFNYDPDLWQRAP